jgi:uncharacterized protein (DUF924 family)
VQLFEPDANDVLDFWFGPRGSRGAQRAEWFRKDEKFDAQIRDRFGELHAKAAHREHHDWRCGSEPMLALVIVLDQFSRNLFRDDPRAFAQDAYARECCREAIARGDEGKLMPAERMFLYMPFEHSEDLEDQAYAIDRMRSLEEFPETKGLTQWAEKHEAVIRRFGRFPHRNAILGRESTPEEIEFLKEPGSRF